MKIELKLESFQKTPCMVKFKKRKFLLMVINIVQFIIILMMLGLLFFMIEEKETETDFVSDVLYLVEDETAVDQMKILLALLCICLILLMVLLNKSSLLFWQRKRSGGVERYAWGGEESLLRKGEGRGVWSFGPALEEVN